MYDHQNPYNSQYPDCIIGPYNYYHPDDPLPYVYNGIDSFGVIILGPGVHVDSPARHSLPSDKAIEGYLNKQGEMSSFSCTHNVFILHYKTANGTYRTRPVQLVDPKRIIDHYSLMSPGDPIPYFSGKRNVAEDYHILSFISISRLQLC